MEIRSPAIRLKIVDFPTLGRPTKATTGLAINIHLFLKLHFHYFNKFYKYKKPVQEQQAWTGFDLSI
ncbi:hypothetical protein LPAF129_01280 [Ligilactobacillus pabuli]|uniref:Transposase n=1 Tax=Ligilactobacillus pabuli TaxID=2886039 RepID=A0ABQ5JF18_9LACO|nr:hypothetical protein LPAF129_01280 [Ligilactobacillus pabuli]